MTTQTSCPANGSSATRSTDYGVLVALGLLGIALIAGSLLAMPWKAYQTQTMELLPAIEGQLSEDLQPIYVSRDRFLRLARGEQVTMAVQEGSVIYEVVLKSISFRYMQIESGGLNYSATAEYEIKDGVLTRTWVRDNLVVRAGVAFVALGCLLILLPVYTFRKIWKERAVT